MTSIMSTTGEPDVRPADPEAMAALLDAAAHRARGVHRAARCRPCKVFASPRSYFDADRSAAEPAAAFDRSFYPEGAPRQLAGIIASGDRADAPAPTLDVPTLVIHGRDDTLIPPSGGERTAELVPGAKLLLLHGHGPRPARAAVALHRRRHRRPRRHRLRIAASA